VSGRVVGTRAGEAWGNGREDEARGKKGEVCWCVTKALSTKDQEIGPRESEREAGVEVEPTSLALGQVCRSVCPSPGGLHTLFASYKPHRQDGCCPHCTAFGLPHQAAALHSRVGFVFVVASLALVLVLAFLPSATNPLLSLLPFPISMCHCVNLDNNTNVTRVEVRQK
jgi:hypothetical protein